MYKNKHMLIIISHDKYACKKLSLNNFTYIIIHIIFTEFYFVKIFIKNKTILNLYS